MPMTMSLSATSAPTVRSRTRLPCATTTRSPGPAARPSTATTSRSASPPCRRLGSNQQQLAPGEARRLPRRPEPPNDPAQDHGSPVVRYRFLALARADFTAAADFFALALFSGFAAFLAATGAAAGLAARAALAAALTAPPSAFAAARSRCAALRRLQHVEQPAVREVLQLGDVVLVLGALQLVRRRRDQLVVPARLLGAGGDRKQPDQLGVGHAQQPLAQLVLALVAGVENADNLVDQLVLAAELFFYPREGAQLQRFCCCRHGTTSPSIACCAKGAYLPQTPRFA